MSWVDFALQSIVVGELTHYLLAWRVVARNVSVVNDKGPPSPRLRRTLSFGERKWRRGELNPCPRRYPRKHLHVYPMVSFKEPNVAPAHCRLPSVHEFPSPSGAVAPPFD